MFVQSVRKGVRWLRSLDVRTVLIVALIVVSAGHVGRLCADGVPAVSLYEVANARRHAPNKRKHRQSHR
jgi:hypothetical protein